MKGYRIYVQMGGVFLKLLPYGNREPGELPAAIDADIDSLGVKGADWDKVKAALDKGSSEAIHLSKETPENFPATCWVERSDAGDTYIFITPPIGNGHVADDRDIHNELTKAGVKDVLISDAVLTAKLSAASKSDRPISFKITGESNIGIQIDISKDKMKAYLAWKPVDSTQPFPMGDVLDKLNELGVVYGIKHEEIEKVAAEGKQVLGKIIAEGCYPQNGEDGKIEFLFDAFCENMKPTISEKNVADFKELGKFKSVRAQETLAKRIPSTKGVDGVDICGKPIPAKKGRDVKLPGGKNTITSSDQCLLVSAIDGIPKLSGGKVVVEEALSIGGDIDLSTGNVDFGGSVTIRGVIFTGFKVRAGADIQCNDVVEGAYINAEGNVILRAGLKGQGKAVIKAGGDVVAKFIESATIIAGGSVIVDEAILNSEIRAAKEVNCIGRKGLIIGGRVVAGTGVRCAILGSDGEIRTVVEVGQDNKLAEEMQAIKARLEELAPRYKQFTNLIGQIDKLQDSNNTGEPKNEVRRKLLSTFESISKEYEEKKQRLAEIQEMFKTPVDGRIRVSGTAYPGVKITINGVSLRLIEPVVKLIFKRSDQEIVMIPEMG